MTTTTYTLADEASRCFETVKRDGTDDYYTRVKDGSPDWLTDLAREAHDGMFPDDWRYACIGAAVDAIADAGEDADLDDLSHEFADGQVDTYTGERFAWLSSNLRRQNYVDDAASEGLASAETEIAERIAFGQYMEAMEVYAAVRSFLEDRAEDADDDENDGDDVHVVAFRHKTPGEGVGGHEWDLSADAARERVAAALNGDPDYETFETTYRTAYSAEEIATDEAIRAEITDETDAHVWETWDREGGGTDGV